jgi:hypothetical protein
VVLIVDRTLSYDTSLFDSSGIKNGSLGNIELIPR